MPAGPVGRMTLLLLLAVVVVPALFFLFYDSDRCEL